MARPLHRVTTIMEPTAITTHAMNLMTSPTGVEVVTTAEPLALGLVGVVLVGLAILIVSAVVFDAELGSTPPSSDAVPLSRHAA